ncbi:uncharacterized protein [Littorina saxatilis]|uniref:Uncharacterized protein n=1 Tax=Littorina saxatilis TaxID=31220 RepID=A0AAN9GLG3_9CAEN
MAGRTTLYVICLVLFPLAFAGFVVGFGTPVWIGSDNTNKGLWQNCSKVIKDCSTFDFDSGGDWLIGVRAVEIFALVMLVVAAVDIVYENCNTNFHLRPLSERLAAGILCILGGLGGLAGVIVYAIKTKDLLVGNAGYSWSLALVAAGAGLAVIVGMGFCVSGFFLEHKKNDAKKGINGHGPYLTSNDENYELEAYTNPSMRDERDIPPTNDNLPGYAMYNGMINNQPGYRNSLPVGPSTTNVLPPLNGRGGPPVQPKGPGYYSISDDRYLDPSFDLSEGFMPNRARPTSRPAPRYGRDEDPYSRDGPRGAEDPYSRGGPRSMDDPYSRTGEAPREEDPYNRTRGNRYGGGPPRAGYNDPYGFDQARGADPYDRASQNRDNFYRPGGRF